VPEPEPGSYDSIMESLEGIMRETARIFESLETVFRLVKIGDARLNDAIEVEVDVFWSDRDIEAALSGMATDEQLQIIENMGWTLVFHCDDGRLFRIRPTSMASLVDD
jgi:hypothetical protein